MPKNMASKGRARQKNIKCKGGGGGTKRILSSFAVRASVIIGSLTSPEYP